MYTQSICLSCVCKTCMKDEHAGDVQSGLKPFSGAFSQGPDHCLLGCPGFFSQNRKQLQFVTSAACFIALCSAQTTEDDVVTQPELRPANTCAGGGFSVIFFSLRGRKNNNITPEPTVLFCCKILRQQHPVQLYPSYAPKLRSGTGPQAGPKGDH